MRFRTLQEVGHDEKAVTLVESGETRDEHNPHLGATDIVLIPKPSNNINDPLRFPMWKKWIIFGNVLVLTFMCNFWLGGLAPGFYLLSLEFHLSTSQAAGLLTWPLLAAGLCNFFWTPTAEYIGRRPVFLMCVIGMFVCEIWASVATSYHGLLASRTLGSFFSSCHESLGPVIVNDIFFLHERGQKVSIFVLAIYLGNSLGTVISGFIIQGVGWRWTSWLCSIISGINVIGIIFFFPETRWYRTLDTAADQAVAPVPEPKGGFELANEAAVEEVNQAPVLVGQKKTMWQDMKVWSGFASHSYVNHLIRPFPLLLYPSVAWGTFVFLVSLAWLMAAGSLSSFIFQVPPYNFGSGVNGLIQLAGLIGNLFGAYFGGQLSDLYVRYDARRHRGGEFLPESRLICLAFAAVICPIGILLFGIGAQHQWHWAILYVSYGFVSVMPNIAVIAMTYNVDSYFEVASEILLLMNGLKAIGAFGFFYGFVPWTAKVGYTAAFCTMAGIWWFALALAVPMYLFGPRIRSYTIKHFKVVLI